MGRITDIQPGKPRYRGVMDDEEGNFIMSKDTGAKIEFYKEYGIYVMYVEVEEDRTPSSCSR